MKLILIFLDISYENVPLKECTVYHTDVIIYEKNEMYAKDDIMQLTSNAIIWM